MLYVSGIGVALGNTLFQVIAYQYFLKYRATAGRSCRLLPWCLPGIIRIPSPTGVHINSFWSGRNISADGWTHHAGRASVDSKKDNTEHPPNDDSFYKGFQATPDNVHDSERKC